MVEEKTAGLSRCGAGRSICRRLAVQLAQELGYQQVILEVDCLLVIQGLNCNQDSTSILASLYQQIRELLSHFYDSLVQHILKDASGLADKLSRNIAENSHGLGALPLLHRDELGQQFVFFFISFLATCFGSVSCLFVV